MSVLTEAALRVLLKDEDLDAMREYRVETGVIVTPSAKAYLIDHKIDLIVGEKRQTRFHVAEAAKEPVAKALPKEQEAVSDGSVGKFKSIYGGAFTEKPEHMTALRGTTLVFKDHKIIVLRGKLDSFEAKILETQLALCKAGHGKVAKELEEVLAYARAILRCEVLEQELEPICLFGMDEAEIRERSHKPQQFYGIKHFFASLEDGEPIISLNALRAAVREVEISAFEAFRDELGNPSRCDIVAALNRLSSALYVMMLRAKAGEYTNAAG